MRILNLYAGIGGNRKLWQGHEITAVELDPKIAAIYRDFFPGDRMLVEDAHAYLLEHYEEYDFIWASPPCPTHSKARKALGVTIGQFSAAYPDMKLYEEILFLKGYFGGKFAVENVVSWYEPLIPPVEIQRHYFWTNFPIRDIQMDSDSIEWGTIDLWQKKLGFDLSKYTGIKKNKILRNCVRPELGLHILNEAMNVKELVTNQIAFL